MMCLLGKKSEPNLCLCWQEWWRADDQAKWRQNRPGPDPTYHPSALSSVPGCGPLVCPDQAHTWHLGLGQELCASIIALWRAC